jgi:N-methylhydantoinase B
MSQVDPIALEVFRNLFISAAEQMGATLGRTAYSPNIKERRDFSCACFLSDGKMIAQAAHIPVHLGAMPASVRASLAAFEHWSAGDLVILNDPYLGGTHLPDITMVSPVFVEGQTAPPFFVASRAHHADVGGMAPGSMALADEIYQEGLILPPVKLFEAGRPNQAVLDIILRNVRTPNERRGDLAAQMAAHRVGEQRLQEITARYGLAATLDYAHALLEYAERLTRAAIRRVPAGTFWFREVMDADGIAASSAPLGSQPAIQVSITIQGDEMTVDLAGSSPAVPGPLNAVRAITESATWYAVYCVLRAITAQEVGKDESRDIPLNSGTFSPVHVLVPRGSFLDAEPPHAVAAGNVETSQRIVDTVLGALAGALPDLIPAASQGTMNNLSIGGYDALRRVPFTYYETVGGGAGAGPAGDGLSGIHVHMTNTLNTPVEALEYAYPLRVRRYTLRRGSGGAGRHAGGEGLVREIECLCAARVTILSERRQTAPYGLNGGGPGACGVNLLIRNDTAQELPGKAQFQVEAGDGVSLNTPGGGGWGTPGEAAAKADNLSR